MPTRLIVFAVGVLMMIGVSLSLLLWALWQARRTGGVPSDPECQTPSGLAPRVAAIVGGSLLGYIGVGLGCVVLVCLVAVVAWFAVVWWAFKDFTLF